LRAAALALVLVAVAGVAACGGGEEAQRTFRNPIYRKNFRDPSVLRVGDTYYAYGTKDAQSTRSGITRTVVPGNVQTLRSSDLVTWKAGKDALPDVGTWAYDAKTWAPEVLDVDDDRFVLYYTGLSKSLGLQCVGRAVADSPEGPFVDRWSAPLVCQKDDGGSIDPSPFRDEDGKLYLLWKNDGNCCSKDTHIWVQRLSADGTRLVGRRASLIKNDQMWETEVVEAPTMWKENGRYYLFYSGSDFASDLYSVGYASCRRVFGPCRKSPKNPLVKSRCEASGPGHQTVVRDGDDRTWLVYHAYHAHPTPEQVDETVVWLDRLDWVRGKPVVRAPTCRRQPAP
jgi:beta-xylosidase